jgi:molybdopterin-guanine dinucleotide biosynthesis protein A
LPLYIESVAVFVLAGGGSTRMGKDKALLALNGVTLIERAIQLLGSIGLEPVIVASREDLAIYAPVVPDLRSGCGPLSGIEAGLKHACATKRKALFIPVDVPLLSSALLLQMIERAWLTDALVTIPRSLGQEQPLSAVYDVALLPAISQALDAGDYKVMRVVLKAAMELGGPQAIDCYDIETSGAATTNAAPRPAAPPFLNCNTPADFLLAEFCLSGQQVQ